MFLDRRQLLRKALAALGGTFFLEILFKSIKFKDFGFGDVAEANTSFTNTYTFQLNNLHANHVRVKDTSGDIDLIVFNAAVAGLINYGPIGNVDNLTFTAAGDTIDFSNSMYAPTDNAKWELGPRALSS